MAILVKIRYKKNSYILSDRSIFLYLILLGVQGTYCFVSDVYINVGFVVM